MRQRIVLIALFCLAAVGAHAQRAPADKKELAAITERGRELYANDQAAWHASDALPGGASADGRVRGYVAERTAKGWRVLFGALTEDRTGYLVLYEATSKGNKNEYTATRVEPPRIEQGRTLARALAIDTCKTALGERGRPYNIAVVDAPDDRLWVYAVPAQTDPDVYPLGGDVRYLVSPDGTSIVETRQMHKSILENRAPKDVKLAMGYHTAVVDEVPEDTDVFYVLTRKPAVPEMIATHTYVYRVEAMGSIAYLGKAVDVLKIKKINP